MFLTGGNDIVVYAQFSKQADILECPGHTHCRCLMGLLSNQGCLV